MPLPQFPNEYQGTETLPVEAMPVSQAQGLYAAAKEGAAGSLLASGLTRIKGYMGDQSFVPYKDAEAEMRLNGYDPSVLPKDGLSRGYLDALKDQQSALKRNGEIADDAGLRHTPGWMPSERGLAAFAGGSVADSPLFILQGGAMGMGLKALGVAARGGVIGFGIRAGEGAAAAGTYDVGRKEIGTAPGDKDLGMYDFARDMAIGGGLGAIGAPRGAGERNLEANNPGNLRVPGKMEFQHFASLDEGVEAVGHQINLYRQRGINTIQSIVEKYAPAKDHNNVDAYVADVAKRSGIDPNTPLTEADVPAVRDAMIIHEQGPKWREKAAAFARNAQPDPQRVAAAAADAMQDRVPAPSEAASVDKSGANLNGTPVWETPEGNAILQQQAEQMKVTSPEPGQTPEVEALNKQANDAVNDAKAAHLLNHEDGNTESFDTHMAEATEGAKQQATLENGVVAALKCAIVKGFE